MTKDSARKNINLLYIFSFLRFFYFWQAIETLYVLSIGGSALTLSVASFFWLAATLLLEVPSGWVSDKYGVKVSLLISSCARLLGYGLVALPCDNPPTYITAVVFFGVSYAFASGSDKAYLYENLEILDKVKNYKKYSGRISNLNILGVVIGSLIATLLVNLFTYKIVFVVSAIPMALALLVVFKMNNIRRVNLDQSSKIFSDMKIALSSIFNNRVMLLFVLTMAILDLSKRTGMDFGQFFINEKFNITWLVPLVWGLGALGRAVGYFLAEHFKNSSYWALALVAILMFYVISIANGFLALIFYVGYFIPINIAQITLEDDTQKLAPPKLRATTLSGISMINSLVSIVPFLLIGNFINNNSAVQGFHAVATVIIIVLLIILIISKLYFSMTKLKL